MGRGAFATRRKKGPCLPYLTRVVARIHTQLFNLLWRHNGWRSHDGIIKPWQMEKETSA